MMLYDPFAARVSRHVRVALTCHLPAASLFGLAHLGAWYQAVAARNSGDEQE
jgi:hypothetical protein